MDGEGFELKQGKDLLNLLAGIDKPEKAAPSCRHLPQFGKRQHTVIIQISGLLKVHGKGQTGPLLKYGTNILDQGGRVRGVYADPDKERDIPLVLFQDLVPVRL